MALEEIVIPEGVRTVGERAFYYCCALESVSVPRSAQSLGTEAFALCTGLNTVRFGGEGKDWAGVSLGEDCLLYAPAESVVCTDGEVPIRN